MEAQSQLLLDGLIDTLVLDAMQFFVIGNDLPAWELVVARVASIAMARHLTMQRRKGHIREPSCRQEPHACQRVFVGGGEN